MRLKHITASFLAVFSLASCLKEEEKGSGDLIINLSSDTSAELIVKSSAPSVSTSEFTVKVTDNQTSEVKTFSAAELVEPIEIAKGLYTVSASNATASVSAGWDAPFYSGSTTVNVRPNRTSTADLVCTLANTMVTASFSDDIMSNFASYRLDVSNGAGGSLSYDSATGTVSKTGFFAVSGVLTWSVTLNGNDGAVYTNGLQTITDVKARQHYNFIFDIEEAGEGFGGLHLKLGIDNSLTEKFYELNMGEGSDENAPVISSEPGFSIEVAQMTASGWTLDINAADGIAQVLFNHDDVTLSGMGIPKWNLVWTAEDNTNPLDTKGVDFSVTDGTATSATLGFDGLITELPVGQYNFYLTVIDSKYRYDEKTLTVTILPPTEVNTLEARSWAKFAILSGRWNTIDRPEGIAIQYRKKADEEWITFTGTLAENAETKIFSAEVYGLDANTEYEYRAVTAKDTETASLSFRTEDVVDIPNLNFDSWYQDGSVWYPAADAESRIWDSANKGTSGMGGVSTTPESSDVAVPGEGKNAAKMQSMKVMIAFAAGNIYLGSFGRVAGMGAILNWGYRFTGRPVALKGWVKYSPALINNTKDPYNGLKGQMDQGSIKFYLTDWQNQFEINTSNKVFVRDDDPANIAIGELMLDSTGGEWIEVTIPIIYKDNRRTPAFVAMAGAASRYGDYFTGGEGSTLLMDEFRLVYDPAELTEEQRAMINYR